MLTEDQVDRAARDILDAERTRHQIPQLSRSHPGMTIADAYAVQEAWARSRIAAGARVVGHKIGLTSRAMQIAVGIDEPDYGRIFADGVFADGVRVDAGRFIKPRIEVELAFVMSADLSGSDVTTHDVLRATEMVMPALEIIDARIEAPRTVVDTIADNAAFGAIVTGGRIVRPMDVDLRWIGATLSRNGVIEESGVSAAVMGHPAAGIAWLVRKLSAVGAHITKGNVVLAGSFTRPVEVAAGDVIHADYGSMGAIGLSFG